VHTIIYEKKGRIAYITLNRPEVLNALNNQLIKELNDAWVDFKNDPEVWVGIISGTGDKAFSAGADVKMFADAIDIGEPMLTEDMALLWTDTISKPLIAAIDGWCLGGGLEIALICDIKIATEKARFGSPEPKVGRNIGGGAISRLPAQIPLSIAMEMLLTGDWIDARRAYEVGLINQLVATSEELMPAAEKMAERILACAPLAVRLNKEQVFRLYNQPIPVQIAMKDVGEEINLSEDAEEGARAFAEKRKPEWQGK